MSERLACPWCAGTGGYVFPCQLCRGAGTINPDDPDVVSALEHQAACGPFEAEARKREDGFRERRRRPKDWLKAAIAGGSVADPEVGGEPHQDYSGRTDAEVVQPPVLTASAEGTGDNGR